MEKSEIRQKIEDGSYYKDALQWYENHYISPIGERVGLFVIATALLLCLTWLLLNIANIWHNVEQIPFPVKAKNSSEYFSYIRPLAGAEETSQESVTKYLITHYVKMWEEYTPSKTGEKDIQHLMRQIRSTSSKQVLNEYRRFTSLNNPYSPLVLYNSTTTRTVRILSIRFQDDDPASGRATVRFNAIVRKGNDAPDISLWEANIQFKLPDVHLVAQTGAPLRFVVRYYRAKPL